MIVRILALMLALALPSGALGQVQDRDPSFLSGETSVASQIDAKRDIPSPENGGSGPAVDASGDQAADPSKNVLDLQRAATQRQDDLRVGSERYLMLLLEANKQMDELRFEMSRELRAAETRRVDDLAGQRTDYERRLSEAEVKRIDAIRAVDVNAAQNTAERAVETASTLQQGVDRSNEAARNLVAQTEQSLAATTRQSSTELSNRITALEQQQYLGQGRSTVTDPNIAALSETVAKLTAAQSASVGQSEGSSNTVTWIIAGVGFVLTLILIGSAVGVAIAAIRRPHPVPNGYGNGNGNGYEYEPTAPRRRRKGSA